MKAPADRYLTPAQALAFLRAQGVVIVPSLLALRRCWGRVLINGKVRYRESGLRTYAIGFHLRRRVVRGSAGS
jgi:hypothetical protein